MSRELTYLLGFISHPTKRQSPIKRTTKHALLLSRQRPPNGGFFNYFLYCNFIEYKKASLLRIMPADENNTSQVQTI